MKGGSHQAIYKEDNLQFTVLSLKSRRHLPKSR